MLRCAPWPSGDARHVMRVGAHPVAMTSARIFAPRPCELQLLQDEDAAPSPMTNPSRSRSKGRLACVGSSLRVERARMRRIHLRQRMTAASAPPAIIASASPCIIMRTESPMALALVAQLLRWLKSALLAPVTRC